MNPAGHDHNKAHTIHRHQQHLSWDNARPPAITIAPGDCVEFKDLDAMGGQITAQSTVGELPTEAIGGSPDLSRACPSAVIWTRKAMT